MPMFEGSAEDADGLDGPKSQVGSSLLERGHRRKGLPGWFITFVGRGPEAGCCRVGCQS